MKSNYYFIILLLVYPLIINGQEGCKTRKPAKFENQPFNLNNKLLCDRFNHTLSPEITQHRNLQLESAIFAKDEFYTGRDFNKSTTSTFNIYSGYKLKYAFIEDFELNLIFNELILYSGDEIEEYGGENPYSRYALAAKYNLFSTNNIIVGLWGQLAFSQEKLQLYMFPELKILLFRKLSEAINITSNLGGAFTSKRAVSFVYSAELKMLITKKVELIFENYTDCVHLNTDDKPSNRFLLGLGSFIRENFYMYLTYEKGIKNSDLLNGKMDLGMAYRF